MNAAPKVFLKRYANDGTEEIIEAARNHYHIPPEKMKSMIESSFKKAEDLSRMIV